LCVAWTNLRSITSLYFFWIIIPSTWTRLPGSVTVKYSRNSCMRDVLLFVNEADLWGSSWVLRTRGFCSLVQRMDFFSNHNLFTIIIGLYLVFVGPFQSSCHHFSCNELLFIGLLAVLRTLEVGAALLKNQPLHRLSCFVGTINTFSNQQFVTSGRRFTFPYTCSLSILSIRFRCEFEAALQHKICRLQSRTVTCVCSLRARL
jgi:hypothetical protein